MTRHALFFFVTRIGNGVGNATNYPDVVCGTRRKSSDVADAVRQPVVTKIG